MPHDQTYNQATKTLCFTTQPTSIYDTEKIKVKTKIHLQTQPNSPMSIVMNDPVADSVTLCFTHLPSDRQSMLPSSVSIYLYIVQVVYAIYCV